MSKPVSRRVSLLRAFLPAALVLGALSLAPGAAGAGPFSHLFGKAQPAKAADTGDKAAAVAGQVRQALDEKRYVDAADLLEKAEVYKITSPRLVDLDGELLLAHGRFADSLTLFRAAAADPSEKARALQGEGLALSMLGKSDEAFADLKQATTLDKSLWRAWNGLGREYDIRHDWKQSLLAYKEALAGAGDNSAIVLNNRGYSHLLQKQTDLAVTDFVDALDKDPALAAARTNLRIAMAIDGHYDRATMTGVGDDRAAVLNNVGLAAAIRGDYPKAEKLLNEAIQAKGAYYERAADNLQLAKELEARAVQHAATPNVTP
ncbi:MAG: tetratricopeptide repeat protein [Caulobacteraceae bacterium]